MDHYKIINMEDSALSRPMDLYRDLYNDSISDKKFNMYKFIDKIGRAHV